MKLLLAAAFLTVSLAIKALGEGGLCKFSDDCTSNECCVLRGILWHRRGECEPLKQIGESCSEKPEEEWKKQFPGEYYKYYCPCAAGLVCQPKIVKEWFGTVAAYPTCIVDIAHTTPAQTAGTEEHETPSEQRETTSEQPETTIEPESTQETQAPDDGHCRSSDDCEPTECCILKGFPIFRRGECEPLAQKGKKCSEKPEASGLEELYENHCPCAAGLICQPEIKETWLVTIKSNPTCVVDIAHTTPAQIAGTEELVSINEQQETTSEQRGTTNEQDATTIESTQETQAPDDV